jgi:hypothetical protein
MLAVIADLKSTICCHMKLNRMFTVICCHIAASDLVLARESSIGTTMQAGFAPRHVA